MLCLPQLAFLAALPQAFCYTPEFRYDKHETSYANLPKKAELPKVPGHLDGSAWLWGPEDGLGRLNFLTPARVKASMEEVRTGEMVPLNLALKLIDPPMYNRAAFEHSYGVFGDGSLAILDEHYYLNTQSSTQWDGFHHFAHLPSRLFYNNCTESTSDPNNHKCGIHEWAAHGIAGRGILLDFASYAEEKGIKADAFDATGITHEQLHAVAAHQGINLKNIDEGGDIRIGDMLMVRMGWVSQYQKMTKEERIALAEKKDQKFIGLEPSEENAQWIHDSYFSAVAGDAPAFETWPPVGLSLHEQVLTFWGIALGEFFDLEKLAEKCKEKKKWTFFVTSAPFNVEDGIATWANALAIL
ncbi:hypothetical protein FPQ18DRAFT_123628 [Pyronema domesticum]|uniref:Uncharacterized protein n=1 Tax=Pyronema omphalodes (strain CBS 100304) TaxID=1076935 RepID=U4LW80_PYROM|nr:hypothetical protein FPQ18DRAFT_123628 [Pyronema domesticum]CCX33331.1 Similar to hypothetical protein CPC735_032850 [Coccidioides posadasii C735 delta SOWgp]; acc. no. XP_003070094 [Pyronema omphalodes CBS 100304]